MRNLTKTERELLIAEVFASRRRYLEAFLESLVKAARKYDEELQRVDRLHNARLPKRRESLLELIRDVRPLMDDWPMTDEEIEEHQAAVELLKAFD